MFDISFKKLSRKEKLLLNTLTFYYLLNKSKSDNFELYLNSRRFEKSFGFAPKKELLNIASIFKFEVVEYKCKSKSRVIQNYGNLFDEYIKYTNANFKFKNEINIEAKRIYDESHLDYLLNSWLHKINNDKAKVFALYFLKALHSTNLSNSRKSQILDFIEFNKYVTSDSSYRFYNNLQQLTKEERSCIFKYSEGYREVDLKAAHFSIFQFIASKYCNLSNEDNIEIGLRKIIADETNTSIQLVKNVINKTLYGSGIDAIVNYEKSNKENSEETKEQILRIIENANYKKIKEVQKLVFANSEKIAKKLNIKIKLEKGVRKSPDALRIHYICTYFERSLIASLRKYIENNNILVALDQHDGLTLKFDNDETVANIDNHISAMNIIIESNKFGIKTSLECKNEPISNYDDESEIIEILSASSEIKEIDKRELKISKYNKSEFSEKCKDLLNMNFEEVKIKKCEDYFDEILEMEFK
jgi:hypothetical protein